MKLIIDIPEEIKAVIDKNGTNEIVAETLWQAAQNGTPIPDNATNGNVIKALFKPNRVERIDDDVIVENYDFNKDWWNSPYQKGDTNEKQV